MGQTVLSDLIADIHNQHWGHIVFVGEGSLSLSTPVVLQTSDDQKMPDGMEIFLSVSDLQGIMEAWSNLRGGRKPTPEQALRAIQYYCEHDAFIPASLEP